MTIKINFTFYQLNLFLGFGCPQNVHFYFRTYQEASILCQSLNNAGELQF